MSKHRNVVFRNNTLCPIQFSSYFGRFSLERSDDYASASNWPNHLASLALNPKSAMQYSGLGVKSRVDYSARYILTP